MLFINLSCQFEMYVFFTQWFPEVTTHEVKTQQRMWMWMHFKECVKGGRHHRGMFKCKNYNYNKMRPGTKRIFPKTHRYLGHTSEPFTSTQTLAKRWEILVVWPSSVTWPTRMGGYNKKTPGLAVATKSLAAHGLEREGGHIPRQGSAGMRQLLGLLRNRQDRVLCPDLWGWERAHPLGPAGDRLYPEPPVLRRNRRLHGIHPPARLNIHPDLRTRDWGQVAVGVQSYPCQVHRRQRQHWSLGIWTSVTSGVMTWENWPLLSQR